MLTLPQEEQLRAALRMAVADHMRPLLAAIGPTIRRGSRTLWGMVSDDLVSGIWYLGRMLGQEGAGRHRGPACARTAVPVRRRLPPPRGRRRPTPRHATRTRAGCCMFHAIRPAEACVTCPRTCDAERLRRLES